MHIQISLDRYKIARYKRGAQVGGVGCKAHTAKCIPAVGLLSWRRADAALVRLAAEKPVGHSARQLRVQLPGECGDSQGTVRTTDVRLSLDRGYERRSYIYIYVYIYIYIYIHTYIRMHAYIYMYIDR